MVMESLDPPLSSAGISTQMMRTPSSSCSGGDGGTQLCPVPEHNPAGPLVTAKSEPLANASLAHRPTVPNDRTDTAVFAASSRMPNRYALKWSTCKSVRFSAGSDEEDDDWFQEVDMLQEAGRRWKTLSEFKGLKEIYRGRISLVASAQCKKSGQAVVLKAYIKAKLSGNLQEMVCREIRLHGKVRLLTGVVEFLGWFEDAVQIVLVMEHCTGGDLYRSLVLNGGEMSEEEAVQDVLSPLLHTLLHVHRMNMCHRDLKPENLFFSADGEKRELKVGDFGLASDLPEMRDRLGTLDYMAPEIILQKDETTYSARDDLAEGSGGRPLPSAGPYTMKVDVWSVGIIAYELLAGRPPFEVSSPQQTAMLIVWGQPKFPESFSSNARDFISQALEKDPEKRPTIIQLLQHPWIAAHCLSISNNLQGGRWLESQTSFNSVPTSSELVSSPTPCEHRKSAPESTLQAIASAGLTSLRGQRHGVKRPVRRAVTVRNLIPGDAATAPKPRKPLKADRTFNVGRPSSILNTQHSPSRTARRWPRTSAGSGGSGSSDRVARPNPRFSRPRNSSRRESLTYGSDDSIEESLEEYEGADLDSAARLAKPGAPVTSYRKSRLSDHSVEGSEPSTSYMSSATKQPPPSILKASRGGRHESDTSVNSVNVVFNVATPNPEKITGVSAVDNRKHSLFGRFFSSIFSCAAQPEVLESSYPHPHAPSEFSLPRCQTEVDDSVSDVSASSAATAGTSQRRGSRAGSSAAYRLASSMNRVLTRFMDDVAPWNTGAQQLRGAALTQPDEQELEAIQTQAASSTRNRVMEYMVRRGGGEASRKSLAEEMMPESIQEVPTRSTSKPSQPAWLTA
mmetsp:Transcript_35038/g.99314  ORF Transcript_35038/g.99314 Transcript_35038/m.99314 type:complete len:850 (+) Transcript_35038:139-2688(+)